MRVTTTNNEIDIEKLSRETVSQFPLKYRVVYRFRFEVFPIFKLKIKYFFKRFDVTNTYDFVLCNKTKTFGNFGTGTYKIFYNIVFTI